MGATANASTLSVAVTLARNCPPAEIVFYVVALSFQNLERLVLDLPEGATTSGDVGPSTFSWLLSGSFITSFLHLMFSVGR
jgi:hypothetical protein